MRTVLFTSDEPFYLPRWLRRVFVARADDVAAVVVAPFGDAAAVAREGLRAFGPVAGARLGARYLAARTLDRVGADRLTGRYHAVPSVARAFDVPVVRAPDANDSGVVERVRELSPELLLSVVCGQKLGSDLLEIPEHAVNVHGSLLPKYRGRAAGFWPLYHGDDWSGVTAHRMTDRLDAGPVLLRRPFALTGDDTMLSVYRKIAATGAATTVELLDRLPDLDAEPTSPGAGEYRSLPTPAERRAFRRAGNRFC
ncbi:MAG: methionyl-tRNA formyltransferase [Haloferacaceae archaeon]